jgi:hypothetical protein
MKAPADRAALFDLLWALCDRSITAAQRDRLEQLLAGDAEARRLFAFYMGMVQDLAWERIPLGEQASCPTSGSERSPGRTSLQNRPIPPDGSGEPSYAAKLRRRVVLALCAAVLVAVTLLALWRSVASRPRPEADPFVATLTGAEECRWGPGGKDAESGTRLSAGPINLEEGLAEITFDSGAKVLLEAPAVFEVRSPGQAYLRRGKLTAEVPAGARGFRVDTPRGSAVALGTEFGIVAEKSGRTDVFAFAGSVEVAAGGAREHRKRVLDAGQALRLTESGERLLPIDGTPFVRGLPAPARAVPRVREMRELVAKHPHLLHHYTFEGDRSLGEHLLDRKGDVPLREVAFGAGSVPEIKYSPGLDDSTTAFTPQRTGPTSGGAALVTAAEIVLPPRLTVECLVQPFNSWGEGFAICTRAAADQRGYFVRKSGRGPHLGTVIGNRPHGSGISVHFVPGHWYYVATTCTHDGKQTTVNLYVANVTAGQEALTHVGGRSFTVPGTYGAAAALRIGMGMLSDQGDCYAFAGAIDEVALYDDVLGPTELQQRLEVLVREPTGEKEELPVVRPPGDP